MNIGFAKIGQSWEPRLTHATTGQLDVVHSLHRLLAARPHDAWTIIGKTRSDPRAAGFAVPLAAPWWDGTLAAAHTAGRDAEMAAMAPWAERLDALVIWLGQIGGAATPLPKLDGSGPIIPLQMDERYAAYVTALVNTWRAAHPDRDAIWLCGDTRNRFALHDFRAPPSRPILAQYDETRKGVFWQGGDVFNRADYRYTYGAVELTGVTDPMTWVHGNTAFKDRAAFGLIANENKRAAQNGRAALIREWVGPDDVDGIELYGAWTDAGLAEMGRTAPVRRIAQADVLPFSALWKATMTFPASGSGWATSKPWEMFAVGTVCFFHPGYDDQGHVIPLHHRDAQTQDEWLLATWLRVPTVEVFWERLAYIITNQDAWETLVAAQRRHLITRFTAERGGVASTLARLEEIGR